MWDGKSTHALTRGRLCRIVKFLTHRAMNRVRFTYF